MDVKDFFMYKIVLFNLFSASKESSEQLLSSSTNLPPTPPLSLPFPSLLSPYLFPHLPVPGDPRLPGDRQLEPDPEPEIPFPGR